MKNRVFALSFAVFFTLLAGVMLIRMPHPRLAEKDAPETMPPSKPEVLWTSEKLGVTQGWRDQDTGLIWSRRIEGISFVTLLGHDLKQAEAACAALSPAGAWRVPSVQELEKARENNLAAKDADARRHWLVAEMRNGKRRAAGRIWDTPESLRIFYLRCVSSEN